MKRTNTLFTIWGVIVVIILALLTYLGLKLTEIDNNYGEIEKKLVDSAEKYVDAKFLYPLGDNVTKVTSDELIENGYLDNLQYEDDVCTGYVLITLDGAYKYDAYIKCKNYTTKGYE